MWTHAQGHFRSSSECDSVKCSWFVTEFLQQSGLQVRELLGRVAVRLLVVLQLPVDCESKRKGFVVTTISVQLILQDDGFSAESFVTTITDVH